MIVDFLEIQVDSLKAKLEQTQNELFSLHNSNLDLTTQLRKNIPTQPGSNPGLSNSSTKYSSPTTSLIMSSSVVATAAAAVSTAVNVPAANKNASPKSIVKNRTNLTNESNAKMTSSPAYDKSAYLEDELARTQKELAKQTSEILSLKNQLSLKQVNYSYWRSVDLGGHLRLNKIYENQKTEKDQIYGYFWMQMRMQNTCKTFFLDFNSLLSTSQ